MKPFKDRLKGKSQSNGGKSAANTGNGAGKNQKQPVIQSEKPVVNRFIGIFNGLHSL